MLFVPGQRREFCRGGTEEGHAAIRPSRVSTVSCRTGRSGRTCAGIAGPVKKVSNRSSLAAQGSGERVYPPCVTPLVSSVRRRPRFRKAKRGNFFFLTHHVVEHAGVEHENARLDYEDWSVHMVADGFRQQKF